MAKPHATPAGDAGADKAAAAETTALALAPDRVNTVFRWILSGNSEHDVREAIAEKFPGAKAEPLIVAAVRQFQAAGEFQPDIVRGWCYEAYRDLYRVSIEAGDVLNALRAVKQIAKLAGEKS